ncbi:glycosyltransferase involved in cell wall biogenesis [Nocardia donostiensis]|uniref:TIGR04282 family arsenosugar biosynthesis glycosyltransferase n=1 Tax=Nocardia donostiensis TaxID=1538463 RepID=UPI0009F113DD|nr:glycosyltransferase involved in cell wall biogenesis [Nocardia donostiensis]
MAGFAARDPRFPGSAAVTGAPVAPVTVLVVAKAPIAGFAKTRLTPPLEPREAARLAAAALLDTLDSVLDSGVVHRVVALTGDLTLAENGREITAKLRDVELIPQRGTGFAVRLANAHADAARLGLPVLQIGMDTPQIGPRVLTRAARTLACGDDAVLGPADDGGWWGLGLPEPQAARALLEVPMSTADTGALTRAMLRRCGYRVRLLPRFIDVDSYDDAVRVAAQSTGRFAALLRTIGDRRLVLGDVQPQPGAVSQPDRRVRRSRPVHPSRRGR